MSKKRHRPRKSLRTILMLWFLLFSVVPLAFITGYSLVKYEQAIDQELSKRLLANAREISTILAEFEKGLRLENEAHIADKQLIYYLSSNNISLARELIKKWLKSNLAQRMWLYNPDGRLAVAMHRDGSGNVMRAENLESGDVLLNEEFLKSFADKDVQSIVDISVEAAPGRSRAHEGHVDLVLFSRVKGANGRLVGFLEEVISMDESFMQNLKNRLNVEMVFFQTGKEKLVATHDDLATYTPGFFQQYTQSIGNGFFELNIREAPYRFMLSSLQWGQAQFIMGLGASKSAARAILANVNYAFFTVVAAIVFLLIVLSIITSRILLRPISTVLGAIETLDLDKGIWTEVPTTNDTELGLLAEGFNNLSKKTFDSQRALREKIKELELANNEIRDTQARLIHTAKMASLGQLVAGIAHELNNPIGFIYSNMSHLRDYSQRLISLVDSASRGGEVEKEKQKVDYDYIVKDLPRLITSCEDGARRTRDIVLGLRNFSRLEESQIKEVDIHEGIENTLQLLTGELKNRITVHRQFSDLPKITCYPSQLNQVFMNILSNAAQAIDDKGDIFISTRKTDATNIEISIRDTGRGISKVILEKIFDPFFTTKTLGQGTGLGLSISYGIVHKHGGEITVQSELGKGTEFIITLPLENQLEV